MRPLKPGILFIILAIVTNLAFATPMPSMGTVEVFFSPRGGATEAVVQEIAGAKTEILVQAYSFTSVPIAKALLGAYKRGVKVVVVLDKSQRSERYTSATFLRNAGVQVLIDDRHAIAHNKIMIIDKRVLITGSFNFTKAAEVKNAENLLVMKGNRPLVERYLRNFEEHMVHAAPCPLA
ncbi:phospholipase D family nuclease [Geomonas agri]|uniref:phospholipase D family nuclease n=1 Tax=Geomonas agri TaxID=2873702 RepID=UPI001CD2D03B|nr:phospholipase D family protein [Geomonas agri]